MKCTVTGRPYTIYGYSGKQVRDNLHASDLVTAMWAFARRPQPAAVYNIGGGRFANCSVLEAIDRCEAIAGRKLNVSYATENRIGDHIWWITDGSAFRADFPEHRLTYDCDALLREIYEEGRRRWGSSNSSIRELQ